MERARSSPSDDMTLIPNTAHSTLGRRHTGLRGPGTYRCQVITG
jgi:hypothetical protein